MDICVIICTYNRSILLKDTVESFLAVHRPASIGCRLLIVDNNSSDATAEISQSFVESYPELVSYVFEGTPGLSNARNTGIGAAKGNLVAFVDDDIYFDPNWLTAIHKAFANDSKAMCVGGKSIPLFEAGEPAWMSIPLLTLYGSTNSGDEPKEMKFPEHPFGLNMAFRREAFNIVGLFDPNLGRNKTSLLSNEETDLFSRINAAGLKVQYAPDAIVHHRIPASRTRKRWLIERFYWQGISNVIYQQKQGREIVHRPLQQARWHLQTSLLPKLWILVKLLSRGSRSSERFSALLKAAYSAGEFRQLLRAVSSPLRLRAHEIAAHGKKKIT